MTALGRKPETLWTTKARVPMSSHETTRYSIDMTNLVVEDDPPTSPSATLQDYVSRVEADPDETIIQDVDMSNVNPNAVLVTVTEPPPGRYVLEVCITTNGNRRCTLTEIDVPR